MADVLVIAEQLGGEIAEVTFELLGKGRELAAAGGGQLVVAVTGSGMGDAVASLAADRVVYVEDDGLADFNPLASCRVLGDVFDAVAPGLTLVANTSMGMDIAAALSVKKDVPLVAYAVDVALEGGSTVVTSQLYGGKIMTESVLEGPGIVSVLAGSFPADAGRAGGTPQVDTQAAPAGAFDGGVRFAELVQPEGGDVDITQHDVLVCVGRGIGSEDNLPIVEDLAKALGGAVCSSRPIVDNKWLPKTRQVGKSGLKVKPKIYVTVGVSGAPEHIEGMKDAELIVAINTDETAPIFDYAHYGTTEDLFDVVPALTEKLQ